MKIGKYLINICKIFWADISDKISWADISNEISWADISDIHRKGLDILGCPGTEGEV